MRDLARARDRGWQREALETAAPLAVVVAVVMAAIVLGAVAGCSVGAGGVDLAFDSPAASMTGEGDDPGRGGEGGSAVGESSGESSPGQDLDRDPPAPAPPRPTPVPTPVPTVTAAGADIIVRGDGWLITRNEYDALLAFVEETHELEFVAPVFVETLDDIGANFPDFEVFTDHDWHLLGALGLLDSDTPSRDDINRHRRDRIVGVCCSRRVGELAVVIEAQDSEVATSMVIVHELVRALHVQNADRIAPDASNGGFAGFPAPRVAASESIPHVIALQWLAAQPPERIDADPWALAGLRIESTADVGQVPALLLNFAYGPGSRLAQSQFDSGGGAGLVELLANAPVTTEQVLFTDRWHAGDPPVAVLAPEPPEGAEVLERGRLGVAMLSWLLDPTGATVDPALASWAGDRYLLYQQDEDSCVAATVAMDNATAAQALADSIEAASPVQATVDGVEIALTACAS